MEQIEQYNPPPNPAKETDTRWGTYVSQYDTKKSWELDALDPLVITALITRAVFPLIDSDAWRISAERQRRGRSYLRRVSENAEGENE